MMVIKFELNSWTTHHCPCYVRCVANLIFTLITCYSNNGHNHNDLMEMLLGWYAGSDIIQGGFFYWSALKNDEVPGYM